MNRKPRIPDFPIIIDRLNQEIKLIDLAEYIGTTQQTLSKIKNELNHVPREWLVPYYLIDLYIRKYGLPIPFYGDHNE